MGDTNYSSVSGDYGAESGAWKGFPLGSSTSSAMVATYDFINAAELDLSNDWVATDVGTMTLDPSVFISNDTPGGNLVLDSDATDGDGNHLQMTTIGGAGEYLLPASGRTISLVFRMTHEDWSAQHWFVGIGETSTTFMDAAGDIAASLELVGFFHNGDDHTDGVPRLYAAGANNTKVTVTPSHTPAAGTDDTYRNMSIRIEDTDKITWYVDDVVVGTTTLASPFSSAMCLTIASVMATAVGDAMNIDLIKVGQTR